MNKNENKYFNTAVKMDKAFLALLEKKDFAYITVKEICEKAGVNRSTFYLHYESLEDLLSESVEYMNESFLAYMKQDAGVFVTNIKEYPLSELYLLTPKYLTPYLNYIKEHKRLFLTAMNRAKALRLEESYDKMFQFVFVPILERYQVSDEIKKYLMAFYIHGLMAIITQWLKNDCKDPIEQIIDVIQRCVRQQLNDKERL